MDTGPLPASVHRWIEVKEWTFLLGPVLMASVNALCFATILYRSGLVPRWMPTLGLIGAPLLLASSTVTLFGGWEQVSSTGILFALPIAVWEFSVGVYMAVKGFNTRPVTDATAVPTAPATLVHA